MISTASPSRAPEKVTSSSVPRWPPTGRIAVRLGEAALAVESSRQVRAVPKRLKRIVAALRIISRIGPPDLDLGPARAGNQPEGQRQHLARKNLGIAQGGTPDPFPPITISSMKLQ